MRATIPITQNLVLVGGGHSHALVLRKIGMNPWPANVQITLITNLADTPYSGMLPCHIAGLYDFDTAHIDSASTDPVCQLSAGDGSDGRARSGRAKGDLSRSPPDRLRHTLDRRWQHTYEISSSRRRQIFAVPAKPVPDLLTAWNRYLESLEKAPKQDSSERLHD